MRVEFDDVTPHNNSVFGISVHVQATNLNEASTRVGVLNVEREFKFVSMLLMNNI